MNKSDPPSDKDARDGFFPAPGEVDVIAHRGGNGQWPGETTYAFENAIEIGVDAIEMDVWGTADDEPVLVLMHSSDLSKTTNGTKKLPYCKFADLENLNAAYRWSPDGGATFPFRNTDSIKVAKLKDVLEEFKDHRMNIEIKQKRPSIVKPFLDAIKDAEVPAQNLLIASFYTGVLKEFRSECKERGLKIATSASTWEWVRFYFGNYLLPLGYLPNAEAIQMAERIPVLRFWLLSQRFIEKAHAENFKVHAWTVNDPDDMQRAIVNGVDGIITDFPGPLRAILDEPDREESLPRDQTGPITSRLANKWFLFRDKLDGFFSILKVVRFSLAMVLLPAIAMIFIEQGREALRILATAPHQPTSQVIAFIFCLVLLTLMAWYWASILVDVLRPGAREEGSPKGWAARQLPRICGLIPALAVTGALIVASEPMQTRPSPAAEEKVTATTVDQATSGQPAAPDTRVAVEVANSPVRFIVFAIISLLFTLPVYALFYFRRQQLGHYYSQKKYAWQLGKSLPSKRSRQLPLKHLPNVSKVILLITIVVWLTLLVIFALQTGDRPITIAPAQTFGTLAIVLFFAAVWIPIGSLLVFWSDRFRFPVFTILLLLAALLSISNLNDNHQVRRINNQAAFPAHDLRTAFNEWLDNRCDRNPDVPYPVFIVSAEGGGLRTAYFTSLVLSAAQDRNPQFAHHVFAISGVSGGSVGGTVFAALTDKYIPPKTERPCGFVNTTNMQDMTNKILGRDLLSPVLSGALYPDLVQRFLFWPVNRFDRSRYLEDGLAQGWQQATSTSEFSNKYSFYQLSNNFKNKSTPALFLNTTQVETGQRVVISSLDLWKDNRPIENLSGLLSINHLKVNPPNLSLATAAFLSARFPVITPPGSLGDHEYKSRYVDGGYFENSGTATLIDLIAALSLDHENSSQTNSSQPLPPNIRLIVINIGTDPVDMKYSSLGIGEITGPIIALLNTRTARGDTATNELETVIGRIHSAEVVHFQAYQHDRRLPTGWLLSEQALQNMQCQLGIAADNSPKQCSTVSHKPSPGRICKTNAECLTRIKEILSGR